MADTASLIARVKTEGVAAADKQLDDFAASAAKAETQTEKFTAGAGKANIATRQAANDGFAKFRNAAGQVGFQVQDMVVQLQSGTSAFVAIGQQGSQLAGAFGPGGAVLGAVIALATAVGGVLYKSLGVAGADMDDLNKRANDLSKSFQITKDGTLELSDSFVQAANSADGLSQNMVKLLSLQVEQNLRKTNQAIEDQRKAWDGNSVAAQTSITTFNDLSAAGVDVGAAIDNIGNASPDVQTKLGNLNQFLDDQASKYGVNKQLIIDVLSAERDYANSKTPEAYQKVADAKGAVAQAATRNKDAALGEAQTAQQLSVDLETLSRQSDVVAAAQDRQGKAANSATTELRNQSSAVVEALEARNKGTIAELQYQAALDKRQFAEKNADNPDLIQRFNKARDEAYRQDVKAYEDAQNRKAAIADNKALAQAKRAESEAQRQQKQAQDFLDTLARQNQDELKAIDTQEQQKLKEAAKYRAQGALTEEEYEKAKTAIVLQYGQKRQDALDKEAAEEQKKLQQGVAVLASIDPVANLQLERQKRLAVIQEYESQENAVHEVALQARADLDKQYEDGLAAAAEERFRNQSEWNDMLIDSLDAVGTSASSSIVGLINGTQTASEAMANLGNAILSSVVSGLTQIGVEYLKNVIIGQTASAMTITTASATGAAIASAYAPAAALASLASFGGNSAPAMAGIATTVAGTQALALTGFREQGGMTNTGGRYLVGERGKPEVIMPAGASRVRTAEQMRQIMGENGGKSSPTSITIVNQTTGRIDDVQQQQDDEDRITLLIREVVSGDLQDSNSKISQSRRVTRNQPGFA